MSETQPIQQQTPPPAAVRAMLTALGYREVEGMPGVPWWTAAGWAGPWADAVDRLTAEVQHLRQVAALTPKHFLRSSEFWAAAVPTLGLAGTALATLSGHLDFVPPAYRMEASGALMALSGVLMRIYAGARKTRKAVAALEQTKVLQQGPQVPAPAESVEG